MRWERFQRQAADALNAAARGLQAAAQQSSEAGTSAGAASTGRQAPPAPTAAERAQSPLYAHLQQGAGPAQDAEPSALDALASSQPPRNEPRLYSYLTAGKRPDGRSVSNGRHRCLCCGCSRAGSGRLQQVQRWGRPRRPSIAHLTLTRKPSVGLCQTLWRRLCLPGRRSLRWPHPESVEAIAAKARDVGREARLKGGGTQPMIEPL